MIKQFYLLNAIVLLIVAGLPLPAEAVDVPQPPNAGLLMRESRPIPAPPKPEAEVDIENTQQQQRPPMAPQNDLKVTVQYFSFHGNSQFSNNELQALLTKYKGHPIGFNDLQAAAAIITDYYRKAGFFVAHAYLPAQAIKNGIVEIVILEGHLDGSHLDGNQINLIGDTRIKKSVIQRFLNTHKNGELVEDADISRLSLLINDLPGIESKAVISPGSKTGTTALSLKVKEGPLINGYVTSDNQGLYSTGYYRFDSGINIVDPLGIGDQLFLRAQTTETGGSVAGWASYDAPINGYGTRLGVNFSELHYQLGRSFSSLNADGIARVVGSSLTHPLYLSRDVRLSGIAHYEHRWMEDNYNIAQGSHNVRELNVMNFAFSGNAYDQLLARNRGLTQAFLSVSAGDVYFTNQGYAKIDSSPNGLNSHGGYHKFYWQLNRTQDIWSNIAWGGISLYANFTGQVASKNLDSSERFSLGGPYGIRAYPVGEANGSEGWIFNGETRYNLPSLVAVPGQFQLIGFIDTGNSRTNTIALPSTAINSRQLTGYGFGINWSGVAGISLRTSLAWRDVSKQPASDPTQHGNGPQAYFQLTKTF
jgi:hemolysin activation/secretion protein